MQIKSNNQPRALITYDEFTTLPEGSEEKAAGWDGAMAQSAFHAVLVKIADSDFDSVIVGQVFC